MPVLFGRTISERTQDSLLGFSAGVMLAASFFSLLMPAIETAERLHEGRFATKLGAIGRADAGLRKS